MDLKHIIQESELVEHLDIFNFPLEAGKTYFEEMLRGPWCSSTEILQKRQAEIEELRNSSEELETMVSSLQSLQEDEKLLLSHKPSETSKVAEGQIFFQGEHTKSLNFIPYCLVFLVFLKVWVAPVLALFTPVVLAVMPYIIMTSIMDMNITWEIYFALMKQMVLGIQQGEPWKLKHYFQAFWTLASMGQGMVTPFITSYHTSKLDAEIVKRGDSLIRIYTIVKKIQLKNSVFRKLLLPEIPAEPHEAVAWMELKPLEIQQFWKSVGRMAVFCQLARDERWNFVKWTTSKHVQLSSISDLAISEVKAVKSTIELNGHSLLTGPNRGGKSSGLRAILQQIILGQTTGLTFGATGSWKPFRNIFTRLKSRDTAGKESLFEMEVRFASKILKTIRAEKYGCLVLIDELFHSTNPPDAETSAKLFLEQLWSHPHAKSMISTHIFSLCTTNHATPIQLFSCQAEELETGKIKYSYQMTEGGVCKISSVREVLREAGLVRLNKY
jgi:cell division protein FtsB